MNRKKEFILKFSDISISDTALVGGKNASLGEMYQKLTSKGVRVPDGFAVTACAYFYFLQKTGIQHNIKQILKGLDTSNIKNLSTRGERVRQTILNAELPQDLKDEIIKAYKKLGKKYITKDNADLMVGGVDVAVRSSATAEDLPDASFAGQQESYLNVRGEHAIIETVKKCIASLFTDRAISYRVDKGFGHFKIGLSVAVQKMVRSDKGASGVMFTIDTESGFRDAILINSIYGLGENIVKGRVSPDEYFIFKPALEAGFKSIISKKLGPKSERMIYDMGGTHATQNVPVAAEDRNKFAITDKEALELARWGIIIEKHYKRPMDIEWARDGMDNKLYIVQARPETVYSTKDANVLEEYILKKRGKVLTAGTSVGNKIGAGKANVIKDVHDIGKFQQGEVLVTEMTDPDWEPIMKKAAAIVTNSGGRTCHSAIVSRELGIPCVVGTKNGTRIIKHGESITVSSAEGDIGLIYSGILEFEIKKTNLKSLAKPKTKIMMNLGSPDAAFSQSFIPNEGVGLAREEFIINSYIKIHPLALIHYNKLKSGKIPKDLIRRKVEDNYIEESLKQINELTIGYKSKTEFYTDKLSQGIATIAAAFYPKEVIVRFSDFKTNEYANLIGGKMFEPIEDNPMIGWRGASRYYDPCYKPAFDLECKALKRVRDEMGLFNVKIMVPFCRTVEEGKKVLDILAQNGLKQSKVHKVKSRKSVKLQTANYKLQTNLDVYMMCEIPSNVILASEFAKIFDGFSIGSNDLTQLALGVDRDSALVNHIYDERNAAVKNLLKCVIAVAKQYKKKIGICGQAPSDFPDFAQFLVREGIDSISLNPDTVIATTMAILKTEKKNKKRK